MAARPKVIIIGAGISGLSAGYHLVQAGQFEVCILEGRSRHGGRLCTQWLGSETMEFGAASIHGTKNNPIYDFAQRHDLLQGLEPAACSKSLSNLGVDHAVFSASGQRVDKKMIQEVGKVYEHIIEMATNKSKMAAWSKGLASLSSVGSYVQSEIQNYLNGCERSMLRERLFDWFQRVECIHSGCSTLHDLNLEDFGEYEVLEGPIRCPIPAGYSRVAQILASSLPGNTIYFDHVVTEIQWNKANDLPGTHPVQVMCKIGKCFNADHVIITIPLGVLKTTHTTLFKPSLPIEKVQSIENLGFGICDKIFLEFKEPFWSGPLYQLNLLWVDPSADCRGGMDNGGSATYPGWVYKLFTFFTISPGSRTLMTWVWGKAAIEMEETSLEKVGRLCLAVLKQFTGITSMPELVGVHRSQWYTDALSWGSYTYVAMTAHGKDIDTLASPLPCEVADNVSLPLQLLFAGEATHRYFFSTVHGAFISGEREAKRIISHASGTKLRISRLWESCT